MNKTYFSFICSTLRRYWFLSLVSICCNSLFAQREAPSSYYDNPFQVTVAAGYGHRAGKVKTDSGLEEHVKNLKHGYVILIDAVYFFDPEMGIGLKYNRFGSQAILTGLTVIRNNDFSSVDVSDNISIDFFGVQFASRWILKNPRHALTAGISPGYVAYRDKAKFGSQTAILTGGAFGFSGELGYNFVLTKHTALNRKCKFCS